MATMGSRSQRGSRRIMRVGFQAVDDRHLHIHQDQIVGRIALLQCRQGLTPIVGDVDAVALAASELRLPFQYSHTASESTHRLSQFEPNETSAGHDQVLRYTVQFQRFDVGQRSGGFEAGYLWNGCPGPNVQEYLIS